MLYFPLAFTAGAVRLGLVEFKKYAIFLFVCLYLYIGLGLVEFKKYAILAFSSATDHTLVGACRV